MYNCDKVQQALAERIFLQKLEECEYFPKYLQIEPTEKCNACCTMCTKSISKNTHLNTMSEKLFDKIASELKLYSDWIEMVTIQWMGEPLLDKHLENKIRILKKIGIKKVSLSTNVSLLTEERCKSLFEAGLDDLRMSIDSVKKSTYEKIRKGLDYATVMRNAINAIYIRNQIRIEGEGIKTIRMRMVDLEETHNETEEWTNFWNGFLEKEDKVQVMPELSKWKRINTEDPEVLNVPCISLFSTMIINSEGRCALCCIDSEFEEELGNIRHSTIKEIWNSEKLRQYRKLHLSGNRNSIDLCIGCNCWNRY